ncbi:LysR family transcriptional regulator [Bradyrhizobium sp. CCGUVB14]|uniref:LysR family transcriptional regulator n=1 Tax=Bradyrhizobium sp. CCGUVB14 TaxID=2949628 RepID=UPI0020B1D440|nr:LysR family transcriptional regulator [Bradyrhizobium sp. CCGUVB14]MCP3441118.1 LysR family transcriptional regulator [Bradyrhizobium sp. CCGUVB14]
MVRLSSRSFARRIDVRSLQLFATVCELGSIGRAADRESLAVSAISKRLTDLEAFIGAQLLYRHTRGVNVTPAGEALLRHVRTILLKIRNMQIDLGEYGDGVRGHVRMQANLSAINQYLPNDLGTFLNLQPKVKIDVEEHLSVHIVRAVAEGDTDLGICSSSIIPASPRLETVPYRTDELVLVVPRKHALAQQCTVSFGATLDFDHVSLHKNSSIVLAMRDAAAAANRHVQSRIRVTSPQAMCRMIENGLGVGIMPRRAFKLERSVGDLVCVELREPWAIRSLNLVSRDFAGLPLASRQLVHHLRSADK